MLGGAKKRFHAKLPIIFITDKLCITDKLIIRLARFLAILVGVKLQFLYIIFYYY